MKAKIVGFIICFVFSFVGCSDRTTDESMVEGSPGLKGLNPASKGNEFTKSDADEIIDDMIYIPSLSAWISKHEVSYAMYNSLSRNKIPKNPEFPLEFRLVNHFGDDLEVFLDNLNKHPKIQELGWTFRLLTEHEWNVCLLAGRSVLTVATDDSRFEWRRNNSAGCLHAVGSLDPNPYGLFDVGGNIAEAFDNCGKIQYHRDFSFEGDFNTEQFCFFPKLFEEDKKKEVSRAAFCGDEPHVGVRLAVSDSVAKTISEDQYNTLVQTSLKRISESKRYFYEFSVPYVKKLLEDMIPVPGQAYKVCKYETTVGLWGAVMHISPLCDPKYGLKDYPICMKGGRHKFYQFIDRLNEHPVVKSSGVRFRLPTLDEWKYFSKAGDERPSIKNTQSENEIHPVGKNMPNAWGIYDVNDNVCELLQQGICVDGPCEFCGFRLVSVDVESENTSAIDEEIVVPHISAMTSPLQDMIDNLVKVPELGIFLNKHLLTEDVVAEVLLSAFQTDSPNTTKSVGEIISSVMADGTEFDVLGRFTINATESVLEKINTHSAVLKSGIRFRLPTAEEALFLRFEEDSLPVTKKWGKWCQSWPMKRTGEDIPNRRGVYDFGSFIRCSNGSHEFTSYESKFLKEKCGIGLNFRQGDRLVADIISDVE